LVDLLAEQEPPGDLNALLQRADVRQVDGAPAPICSLEDLVRMKREAGRVSDLEDLSKLEAAHGQLPSDPPA
jgi:hypothetical protein